MASLRIALIIPAAGAGKRLGSDTPKPYLNLAGKPILEHTLTAFASLNEIEQVIVSTSESCFPITKQILNRVFPGKKTRAVPGGRERQDSIHNALQFVEDEIDLIGIHDAVRPFIERDAIVKCFQQANKMGGAIVAIPAKDTIKRAGTNMKILDTPNRENLWQAQTPQFFQKELLLTAYNYAKEHGVSGTDDASLVEKIGGHVTLVEGNRENFKITYPLDLTLAELLLKED